MRAIAVDADSLSYDRDKGILEARGDVVITNDIPLAARCLTKGVRVLGQKGKEFTEDSIGSALAGRELSQNLRELGVAAGGPRPTEGKDRSRFLGKLDQILVALNREASS